MGEMDLVRLAMQRRCSDGKHMCVRGVVSHQIKPGAKTRQVKT